MVIIFDMLKVPRTTTRPEWYKMYRGVRETARTLRKHEMDQIELLRTHGHTMPARMKADLMEKIINPPIVLGPHQW